MSKVEKVEKTKKMTKKKNIGKGVSFQAHMDQLTNGKYSKITKEKGLDLLDEMFESDDRKERIRSHYNSYFERIKEADAKWDIKPDLMTTKWEIILIQHKKIQEILKIVKELEEQLKKDFK